MEDNKTDQVTAGQNKKSNKITTYLMLHGIILLYSFAAICSKKASLSDFPSISFFIWYGTVLVILVVYAFVWQQVLKRMTLFAAFANKGITIIWGILWGALIFSEHVKINMLFGSAIVFVGILLVVASNAE